jgi:hypothetical protein
MEEVRKALADAIRNFDDHVLAQLARTLDDATLLALAQGLIAGQGPIAPANGERRPRGRAGNAAAKPARESKGGKPRTTEDRIVSLLMATHEGMTRARMLEELGISKGTLSSAIFELKKAGKLKVEGKKPNTVYQLTR